MTRPASSSQSRTHGLVPRFRYGYTDQHIRVSDAERTEVADRLAAHFAEGRLNQAEFDERVAQAMNATTRGDLSGLFDDLPEPGPAGTPGTPVRGQHSPAHPAVRSSPTCSFLHLHMWSSALQGHPWGADISYVASRTRRLSSNRYGPPPSEIGNNGS